MLLLKAKHIVWSLKIRTSQALINNGRVSQRILRALDSSSSSEVLASDEQAAQCSVAQFVKSQEYNCKCSLLCILDLPAYPLLAYKADVMIIKPPSLRIVRLVECADFRDRRKGILTNLKADEKHIYLYLCSWSVNRKWIRQLVLYALSLLHVSTLLDRHMIVNWTSNISKKSQSIEFIYLLGKNPMQNILPSGSSWLLSPKLSVEKLLSVVCL